MSVVVFTTNAAEMVCATISAYILLDYKKKLAQFTRNWARGVVFQRGIMGVYLSTSLSPLVAPIGHRHVYRGYILLASIRSY